MGGGGAAAAGGAKMSAVEALQPSVRAHFKLSGVEFHKWSVEM